MGSQKRMSLEPLPFPQAIIRLPDPQVPGFQLASPKILAHKDSPHGSPLKILMRSSEIQNSLLDLKERMVGFLIIGQRSRKVHRGARRPSRHPFLLANKVTPISCTVD